MFLVGPQPITIDFPQEVLGSDQSKYSLLEPLINGLFNTQNQKDPTKKKQEQFFNILQQPKAGWRAINSMQKCPHSERKWEEREECRGDVWEESGGMGVSEMSVGGMGGSGRSVGGIGGSGRSVGGMGGS